MRIWPEKRTKIKKNNHVNSVKYISIISKKAYRKTGRMHSMANCNVFGAR